MVLAVAHHPLGGRLASASSYLSSQSLANSRSDLHALRGLPTLDLVVLSPAPSGRDGDGRTDGTPPPHRFCCAVYFRVSRPSFDVRTRGFHGKEVASGFPPCSVLQFCPGPTAFASLIVQDIGAGLGTWSAVGNH